MVISWSTSEAYAYTDCYIYPGTYANGHSYGHRYSDIYSDTYANSYSNVYSPTVANGDIHAYTNSDAHGYSD